MGDGCPYSSLSIDSVGRNELDEGDKSFLPCKKDLFKPLIGTC